MRRFVVTVVVSLAGCSALTPYRANYELRLREVARPSAAAQQFGPQQVTPIADSSGYVFEDGLVRVEWQPHPTSINVTIHNRTEHTIRVLWDNAAFVDKDGRSNRVMHAGVPFAVRDQPQAPSVIVRGGRLEDVIIPTEYVTLTASSWTQIPFFGVRSRGEAAADSTGKSFVGRRVQVLLPLEIQGVQNDYIFTFEIHRGCYYPIRMDGMASEMPPTPASLKCRP